MNLPNIITLARVIISFLVCIVLCFNFSYAATTAYVLYVVASLSDWLDGYFARKSNLITNFGKFMDALCDKIMILGIVIMLIALDTFEWATLLVAFCTLLTITREFFVSGLRMLAAKDSIVIAADKYGKIKTIIQMLGVGSVLLAHCIALDFACINISYQEISLSQFFLNLGIALYVLSTFFAVQSGIAYTIKYGHVFKS
ncbi:MAG: CDP-diacylglycerol--glycerol-3-phosphate 3-phosphatidyltransferase [Opitutales bacterium]